MRSLLKNKILVIYQKKMPKSKERKLFKCVRKTINGDKNFLAVKFKNLGTNDIREVKLEINALLKDFWATEEELEYSDDNNVNKREPLVQFEHGTKQ